MEQHAVRILLQIGVPPTLRLPWRRVVLRKVLIAAAVAGAMAAPASADIVHKQLLMPGVTYTRDVEFTPHGPVVVHVLTAPRPDDGLYAFAPVLSQNAILGKARLTDMEKALASQATVAGVNGDLFSAADAHPSGVLMRDGVLDTPPNGKRSSVGIGSDGTLHVDLIQYQGAWRGTGQRRPLRLNQPVANNTATLYTQAWGSATPQGSGDAEAVISSFPSTRPNADLTGVVTQIVSGGNTPIPPGGAVLVGTGSQASKVTGEAPVGRPVTVRLTLTPSWDGIVDAIGGGPVIVRGGRPIFRADEEFSADQLGPRDPRTAVGQLADGSVVLVAVDGRKFGYSVGVTNFELALTMAQLGCTTASALGAGGATAMAFEGTLLNRPSDPGGEEAISDALMVMYYGVYAPPPAETILSPNGDGVADTQTFQYKVVRASTVTATLMGPDKVVRTLDDGGKQPGTYTVPWNGQDGGKPAPEGSWRFSVSATDGTGRTSSADRAFAVNETLGFLKAEGGRISARGTAMSGSFTLAHPAKVTATVATRSGAGVRTLMLARSLAAGTYNLAWNGRSSTGRLAFSGAYVLRVQAANPIGRVALETAFTARR
jgi:flagellar hook assembly protein FlgD